MKRMVVPWRQEYLTNPRSFFTQTSTRRFRTGVKVEVITGHADEIMIKSPQSLIIPGKFSLQCPNNVHTKERAPFAVHRD